MRQWWRWDFLGGCRRVFLAYWIMGLWGEVGLVGGQHLKTSHSKTSYDILLSSLFSFLFFFFQTWILVQLGHWRKRERELGGVDSSLFLRMGCVEFPCFFLLSYLGGFVFFSFCIEREREGLLRVYFYPLSPPPSERKRQRENGLGWKSKANR